MSAECAVALERLLALQRHFRTDPQFGEYCRALQARGVTPDAGLFRRVMVQQLGQAEPFYWATALVPLLEQIAPTIPDWTLRHEDLPVPHGFIYFGRAASLGDLPWDGPEMPPASLSGLFWTTINQEVLALFGLEPSLSGGVDGPMLYITWRFGGSLNSWVDDIRVSEGSHLVQRYWATALAFMQQRILVHPRERITDRAAVRRLAKAEPDLDPYVRVVRLRRTERIGGAEHEAGEGPDWSCQWVVRGHWRQQWYPSLGTNQPRWIMPYVKGPDDKPLKTPGATVFAVVR